MPTSGLLAGPSPGSSVQGPDLFPFRRSVQRLLPMERIRELYRRAQQPVNRSLLENVLAEMRVEYQVSPADLARIPGSGPVLVTANHPFGVLDGAILGALLSQVRPDVKLLTNFLLAGIPELHEHCIFVDPFGSPRSAARNGQALRQRVEVRIGSAISADAVGRAGAGPEVANYLRWRTYLLAQRRSPRRQLAPALRSMLPKWAQQPVAPAVARQALLAEFEQLSPQHCLEENREFSVHVAQADEIPVLMQELGRLREATFREAGEGSGKCRDLDCFDRYYKHVLLWSKVNRELAGAYRMGLTGEILPARGASGLYTSTLFRYHPSVFERLGPALELGRSFVRPEYQRQYAPLLMLWKGIGRYLAAHPELAVLFGAVSISSRYNRVSRELIVRFFQAREKNHELARLIAPRRPFQPGWIRPGDCPTACDKLKNLDELADPIGDLETDGKGIPILLKQYAKLGGRLVSFNVDRNFSDVLDGLVLVDLRQTDPVALARYMGKDGVAAFRRYHSLPV